MGALVYRHYDQASLDREYDNARKIPDGVLAAHRARWAEASQGARATLRCSLDLAYGSAPGEKLDVFRPPGDGLAPVQIYIHGGYWSSNDKADCSYVALGFTGAGCVTIVINYGLIPGVDMTELVRQCRMALCWVFRSARKFGGDPQRIYVTGHSAGAHLAVMLLTTDFAAIDPTVPRDVIRGAVALSGIYDLEPIRLSFVNKTLNLTEEDVARFSPVRLRPLMPKTRLLLAVGGEEGEEYLRQSRDLAEAWRGEMPNLSTAVLPQTDHFSIRAALDDPGSEVCRLISAQMGLPPPAQAANLTR